MKLFLTGLAVFTSALAVASDAALPAGAADPVVNVNKSTIVKLNAADGTVQWSVAVANDGALAVDPGDFSVYTARGGQSVGTDGTVYKFGANGLPTWTNSLSLNSYCDFQFITNAAVDATSSSPGVIWSESGCFGALAKSDRATGAQQWSVLNYDIRRPSIDPTSGQIFDMTSAGNNYNAETIYSVSAGGSVSYASSCEGFTDLNPADSMLYRAGGDPQARGCGTTLSQMNNSVLGSVNWSMDLSGYVSSIDALAVQPWQGGYVYVGSVASSKMVVVDPSTQNVVTSFSTAIPPRFIALSPDQGNVYVASEQSPFVAAYSPTGALVWINPNLGGNVSNLATARGVVGGPTINAAADSTCPAITLTPTTLSTALEGLNYNRTITATGGSGIYTFAVFNGSLPPGLTLGLDGNLSGIPTTVGSFPFTVVATDFSTGCTGGQSYTIQVEPVPTCPAPTVRIFSDRNSIHKGESATITLNYGAGSAGPCQSVTVHFTVKTKAKSGVDFTLTDANGQDATVVGAVTSGPLTLQNLYTSRKKTLPVNISLTKDPAYYLGNKKVSVQLLAK